MAEIKKQATREAYGEALVEIGHKYDNLVVLDADLSGATKTSTFKKEFPDRFFNCGIAEQNLIGVATGLTAAGKLVFCSSFAMFAAGRAFEQVRNAVGYTHLNVKIAATHAGLSVGEDGATHQCNEDIALMRVIPGMTILSPADGYEAKACVRAAAEYEGPTYLRFGRMAVPFIFEPDYKIEIGKGVTLKDGNDVTIIATGLMTGMALEAAKTLGNEGINARVINIHTIKPLDKELIINAARQTAALVTCEEASVIGGLGSAVCEALSESLPTPVIRVGVEDKFGTSGPAGEVLKKYGLCPENIVAKAKAAIALKK